MNQTEPLKMCDIPKIFVVCNQSNVTPVWGYILRQHSLSVILETSSEKARDCSYKV